MKISILKSWCKPISLVFILIFTSISPITMEESSAATLDCTVSGGSICKSTFTFSGAYETFTVPSFISSITIELAGAQGGSGTSSGGLGGYVKGELSVTPSSKIFVYVGGQNGWNGGGTTGAGTYPGSFGGGASDIRIGGYSYSDRKAVGGGGGGAGKSTCNSQAGGAGGYPGGFGGRGSNTKIGDSGTATSGGSVRGSAANVGTCDTSTTGGGGGGQNGGGGAGGYGNAAGGTSGGCGAVNSDGASGGGSSTVPGQSGGCFGTGGNGGTYSTGAGGGGGGGWYGGGAGGSNWSSGGGGGSSYLGSMTSTSYTNASQSGNGFITISYANISPSLSIAASGSTLKTGKGETLILTSQFNVDGRLTFFADGKRIAGCVGIIVTAGSRNCNWKSSIQKSVKITAELSQNGSVIAVSTPITVIVVRRTGTR